MPVIAFDTYAYVKKLRDANLPEAQASAHAEALKGLIETNLASKDDIKEVSYDIKEVSQKVEQLDKKIDTVAEQLDKKINTVAEQLDKKIDTVAEQLNQKIDTDIKEVSYEIKEVSQKVEQLDKKIDTVAEQLNQKIDTEIANNKKAFAKINSELDNNRNEFAIIRQEFSNIRQEIANNQAINDQKFEQVRTAFAKMDAKIAKNHSTMIKWIIALIMASTTLNISLMKLLF